MSTTPNAISRETILATCRKLVSEEGLGSLNMRAVASACGIALGSIYYYFPSKNDLLIATIESVWEDIFRLDDPLPEPPKDHPQSNRQEDHLSFVDYLDHILHTMVQGTEAYPNFFTIHSMSLSESEGDQARGKKTMDQYLDKLEGKMLQVLRADEAVQPNTFTQTMTEEDFVQFVMKSLVWLLVEKEGEGRVLLEVVRRILYGG